jgi:hypothetical protein
VVKLEGACEEFNTKKEVIEKYDIYEASKEIKDVSPSDIVAMIGSIDPSLGSEEGLDKKEDGKPGDKAKPRVKLVGVT